mmetsp:Transcript_12768/g.15440  ORF Transcript_12768/g.15440 Transcript_12768/m.15440 type:complete len:160 (-) Transcript_12768:79-558(-)
MSESTTNQELLRVLGLTEAERLSKLAQLEHMLPVAVMAKHGVILSPCKQRRKAIGSLSVLHQFLMGTAQQFVVATDDTIDDVNQSVHHLNHWKALLFGDVNNLLVFNMNSEEEFHEWERNIKGTKRPSVAVTTISEVLVEPLHSILREVRNELYFVLDE